MSEDRFPIAPGLRERVGRGLEGAGPRASLLLFTLGPVQRFIAAARRTSDLRAGSFLLSWLTAAALRTVHEAVGPDAVFFPDLASEPALLQAWKTGSPLPADLALPNRFLAAVPSDRAAALAGACEKAARDALAEAVAHVRSRLGRFGNAYGWHEADDFLECAWAALPFDGSDYGEAYRRIEQAVGGVKALRPFAAVESTGFRDSLVPALGALVPSPTASKDQVDKYWKQGEERLRLRGGEQLSAVSLTKRRLSDHLGRAEQDYFPSTASIAVADFKREVLKHLGDADLRAALEAFQRAVAPLDELPAVGELSKEQPLPLLDQLARTSGAGHVAQWFAALPGDRLYDDFFTVFSFEREYEISPPGAHLDHARRQLQALLRVADALGIRRPSRYYGLIVFDGDRMGKWLSGEVTGGIEAAGHLAISQALATFARGLVPPLVEKQFLGRLVYAGGDDVLAFVSFDDALPLLRALRAAFSGHVVPVGERFEVDWSADSGAVDLAGAARRTLGPLATASAGLVLAHQQEPLHGVLEAGREAEHAAKGAGRNRFALALGRRSGERFTATAPWRLDGADVIAVVEHLSQVIRAGELSAGFAYDARDILSVLPPEAVGPELRRLFRRRTERVVPVNGESRDAAADRLWTDTVGKLLPPPGQPGDHSISTSDALLLVQAAVIFGKGGDRER